VLALSRHAEGGAVRERFRTLHRRDTAPVFAVLEEDGEEDEGAAVERPDLAALARQSGTGA
jgi:hypothetical protein